MVYFQLCGEVSKMVLLLVTFTLSSVAAWILVENKLMDGIYFRITTGGGDLSLHLEAQLYMFLFIPSSTLLPRYVKYVNRNLFSKEVLRFLIFQQLEITEFIPTLLYFGYTGLMVLTFWLLTGTIGFYAAYFFIRKIYAAIKID